jgi:MYXO-CTERM domain-containing protein
LDGDELLVAYDRQQELTLIPVTLDLSQFSQVQDTGPGETDTGDTGLVPGEPCGCHASTNLASSAGLWLLGLGLLLLRRRLD